MRITQESPGADSARVYFIDFHPLCMTDVTTKILEIHEGANWWTFMGKWCTKEIRREKKNGAVISKINGTGLVNGRFVVTTRYGFDNRTFNPIQLRS